MSACPRRQVKDVAMLEQVLWEMLLHAAGRFGRPAHEGCGRE